MSIIGSVGGSGSELMQMLQRLAGQSESPNGSGAPGSPPRGGFPPGGPPEGGAAVLADKVGAFAKAAGLDSETVTSLQDQLGSGISAALEDTDGSADPRELIGGAILSTLEEYGLDGEAFLSELKASMPTGGPSLGGLGSQLPSSDIVSQMFSLLNGNTNTSTLSANVSLLDAVG